MDWATCSLLPRYLINGYLDPLGYVLKVVCNGAIWLFLGIPNPGPVLGDHRIYFEKTA